jgi:hypothetical protein
MARSRSGRATNNLDLEATHKVTGTRYGVSVKNLSEHINQFSSDFDDVIDKVKGTGLSPMLVTTHAITKGEAEARFGGIRLVTTGGLMVPARHVDATTGKQRPMYVVLRELRPVTGPEPIIFVPQREGRAEIGQSFLMRL